MTSELIYEPRARINFGKFRFVEFNLEPKVPSLQCCPHHGGDTDYCVPYDGTATFDNSSVPFKVNTSWTATTQPSMSVPLPSSRTNSNSLVPSIVNVNNYTNQSTIKANFDDSFDDDWDDVDPFVNNEHQIFDASKLGFPNLENDFSSRKSPEVQLVGEIIKNPTQSVLHDSFDDNDFEAPKDNEQHYYTSTGVRHDMHGQFKTYLKDDGDDFMDSTRILGFQRDQEMYQVLKNVFGHNEFRFRQKAAIVAILANYDCFILMPTGAGKSLCYQLPAIIFPGVTIVVSPLISLIEDQVTKLRALRINAKSLKSSNSPLESAATFNELNSPTVNLKLLYVTPEMIGKSARFMSAMENLHRRGLLSRIVVDEAHCISQWGHDFRPDYTKLNHFIEQFNPHVPIIALTASATPKIVTDIRAHLNVPNSKLFMSSFVRNNLKYDLHLKNQTTIKKLITELKLKFPDEAGIVYCFSCKDCESMAGMLSAEGFKAEPYHAGLSDHLRSQTQNDWMEGKINVICATIAFGMGIDKPNVRFIVHHSLPKSIEGYYQETGRAGRDGNPSYCILLYSYHDSIRIRSLQEKQGRGHTEIGKQQKQALYDMVNYCENVTTCRRKILVEHFGEIYDAAACQGSAFPCSICENIVRINKQYQLYDITDDAKAIIESVINMKGATISYMVEIYRGNLSRKNQDKATTQNHLQLKIYKKGSALNENDAQRILRKLVTESYLDEIIQSTTHGGFYGILHASEKGRQFINGNIFPEPKIYIHLSNEKKTRTGSTDVTFSLVKVSESAALKEKYGCKHEDLYKKCKKTLLEFFQKTAKKNGFSSYMSIISYEGLEQLAAVMPRTNSELLHIDSMTREKVTTYCAEIMDILKPFWKQVDDREHESIQKQIGILKSATASLQQIEAAASASNVNNYNYGASPINYVSETNYSQNTTAARKTGRGGYAPRKTNYVRKPKGGSAKATKKGTATKGRTPRGAKKPNTTFGIMTSKTKPNQHLFPRDI